MQPDPPRRRDGLCACGCGRPVLGIPPRRQKGIPDEVYLREPFATTGCCKAFHGVVTTTYSESTGRGSRKGRHPPVAA